MRVGIRELKAHLSAYLDKVEAGTTIVVTERGRAKAELAPVTSRTRLHEGIESGWVTPPSRVGSIRGLEPRIRTDVTVQQMLDEDRAERE